MKRITALLIVPLLAIMLTGCPSTTATQRQQAAQASDNISIVLQGAQQAEIAAHGQGLIPDADHIFVQQQFSTIAKLGKTTDSCILNTTTTAGTVDCLNSAVATIDQINSSGGLYLKSAKAKEDFALTMTSVRAVLASVATVLGGK
jgi:PBP1b-binding outer membrane lipoprotein LpoB